MKICPECRGEKIFIVPSTNPLSVYDTEGHTEYDIFTCSTCKGKGQISELQLAIYNARGGPAPPSIP